MISKPACRLDNPLSPQPRASQQWQPQAILYSNYNFFVGDLVIRFNPFKYNSKINYSLDILIITQGFNYSGLFISYILQGYNFIILWDGLCK